MAEKKLIVNADGFGFGPGATQGILDAIAGGGPITSVSVNANFPDSERLRELVKREPMISVGVHLNPIAGAPCLPTDRVSSLVGPDGLLHGGGFLERWRAGMIVESQMEVEFDEQIRRVKELASGRLTHLDSHQNSHLKYFDLFLRLALKWRIPFIRTNASLIGLEGESPRWVRLRTYLLRPHVWVVHLYRRLQMRRAAREGLRMADRLVTVGYAGVGNKAVLENWVRILQSLPSGVFEIYCHPAYPDDVLRRWAAYTEPRAKELEILRSSSLRDIARTAGVRLTSFLELLRS